MSFHTLINGVAADPQTVTDRGLAYGDGLFETFRVCGGDVLLFTYHWQRLVQSAQRLSTPLPFSEQELRDAVRYCVGGDNGVDLNNSVRRDNLIDDEHIPAGNGVVKLILTRGQGGRGYRCPLNPQPFWSVHGMAQPSSDPEHYRSGVSVRYCDTRLSEQPLLAGMKHLNRLEQVLARQEWQDQVFEGLMFSRSGLLVEATMANLFLLRDRQLMTPRLNMCGVQGVMRDAILDYGRNRTIRTAQRLPERVETDSIRLQILEGPLTEHDLQQADAVFLCNGVRGIIPVARLQSDQGDELRSWPSATHPVVLHLMQFFHPPLQLPFQGE